MFRSKLRVIGIEFKHNRPSVPARFRNCNHRGSGPCEKRFLDVSDGIRTFDLWDYVSQVGVQQLAEHVCFVGHLHLSEYS
jgi:hypothetical protein